MVVFKLLQDPQFPGIPVLRISLTLEMNCKECIYYIGHFRGSHRLMEWVKNVNKLRQSQVILYGLNPIFEMYKPNVNLLGLSCSR